MNGKLTLIATLIAGSTMGAAHAQLTFAEAETPHLDGQHNVTIASTTLTPSQPTALSNERAQMKQRATTERKYAGVKLAAETPHLDGEHNVTVAATTLTPSQPTALSNERAQMKQRATTERKYAGVNFAAETPHLDGEHNQKPALGAKVPPSVQQQKDTEQDADISDLKNTTNGHTKGIYNNHQAIVATSKVVDENSKNIANNTATIKSTSKNVNGNTKAIASTNSKVKTLTNQQKIESVYYNQQIQALADNSQNAANNNRSQIRSTQARVNDNTASINKLNSNFSSLKSTVDDNRKEANAGIAGATAIASMPQVKSGDSFMVSAGAGTFNSESAVAVGASFNAGDHTVIKAGVSADTQSDFGAGVGIGFSY
ncbi:MAG: YadA-like family protein [Hafnia sp.]|uniref:YadA-like family protein n=1 Tax=Hafnia sp. TaxID=1873498 RepID=UPI002FC62738